MRPGMELKDLEIWFPQSEEEADGAMLTYCVPSIEKLTVVGPRG